MRGDLTQDVRIEPVQGRAGLKRFVRAAFPIYGDDPCWVKPLMLERLDLLDAAKNPLFDHMRAAFWIAWRGDRPVGRISAQIDRLAQERIDPQLGYFGMFECIDDPAVASALFETAEGWLKAQGITRARGPFNLSVNSELGLLVDGFDTPPMLMMGHARPYYGRLVERAGYAKARDLYAYILDVRKTFPPVILRVVDIARRDPRITIRQIDLSRYDAELDTIMRLFNAAWAENWGFVPFTDAEAKHAAKSLKPLINPQFAQICEYDGEPAAFMITLPDINDWIADLDGRLLPFGWAKLLWRIKRFRPRRVRVPLMGVRPDLQRSRAGGAMAFLMIETIRAEVVARGGEWGELSWILEDNKGMNNILEQILSRIYKTYRIYEKALA